MADEQAVAEARRYIEVFRKHTVPGTDNVTTNTRTIWLDRMTDEDAVFVAQEFKAMEAEAARRRPCPVCGGIKRHLWNCSLEWRTN